MKFISAFVVVGIVWAQSELFEPSGPTQEFYHFEPLDVRSGPISADARSPSPLFKKVLTATDAIWVRASFRESTRLGDGVHMRVTSLYDGYYQLLTDESLDQWQHKSAYLNGDSLLVEVFANGATTRDIQIDVDGLVAGEDPPPHLRDYEKTLCFSFDNRIRAQERNKDARFNFGGGCSGWLIDDAFGCFLTAGHCDTNQNGGTMSFNVPDSNANGGSQNPPPDKQYTVDRNTIQGVNGGVGNDWRYLGVFPNSNTGLTPRAAQSAAHVLRTNTTAPPSGITWQHYGHGSASGVTNLVCKGSQGSLTSVSGSTARYRISTTGGDSGSAVTFPGSIADPDGEAVAIHTHGGCSATGGSNAGTWLFNAGLQNALRNPRGACATGY